MVARFDTIPFQALDTHSLYEILRLRQQVFAVEQLCSYQDCDGYDIPSRHLYYRAKEGEIVAYCRIIPPDILYAGHASIGRVVVARSYRSSGLGRALMQEAIRQCEIRYSDFPIQIEAQCYLTLFYQRFGFITIGDSYLLDGIPHIEMVRIRGK